jgi:hypothetical protein
VRAFLRAIVCLFVLLPMGCAAPDTRPLAQGPPEVSSNGVPVSSDDKASRPSAEARRDEKPGSPEIVSTQPNLGHASR